MSSLHISNSAAAWRNGANCNFFGGIAKIFCKNGIDPDSYRESFRLDFLFLFHQGKRKIENEKNIKLLLNIKYE